ncbi:sensor histidine kinase [Gorillibacterium massiliense]|uniref:sensor histidine kinase n=1 Tax=Gorillibacterium massiliense TaxID=1280390 RepID=UPI0004B74E39|nr:histidine kinase [Gorillibacterium massiliense]
MEARKRIVIILGILIIYGLIFIVPHYKTFPKMGNLRAEQGVMDASSWDFHQKGNLLLNGEWEFYPDQMLTPEDFHKGNLMNPDFKNVPSTWKGRMALTHTDAQGYATYRLILHIAPDSETYGIKTTNIQTSNRLFVDGKLRGESGTPSSHAVSYKPGNLPYTTYFSIKGSVVEIVVQVANYDTLDGGILKPIYFGLQNDITRVQSDRYSMNLATFFLLSVFGAYHLAIFFMRRTIRGYLYLGLFFLIFSMNLLLWDEKILIRAYPDIPFHLAVILQSLSMFAAIPFLALFIRSLEEQLMPGWMVKLFLVPVPLLVICSLIFPFSTFVFLAQPLHWLIYLTFMYSMVGIFSFLFWRKKKVILQRNELVLLNASLISLLMFWIGDYLHNLSILRTDLVDKISFTAFIGTMVLSLAMTLVNSYNQKKQLNERLIRKEMDFLQVQIKPHFLYNTINTAISLSYTDSDKAAELLTDFSRFLRLTFDTSEADRYVTVQRELELVQAYAAIEQARFGERVRVEYIVDPELNQILIPPLSIQPLVENAIRHGLRGKEEGGCVVISVNKEQNMLKITISDDGIGIPEEKMTLLSDSRKSSRGTGIGIQNVRRRILSLRDASLTFSSRNGHGTEVVMILPLEEEIQILNS